MNHKTISTDKAPAAVGPYSQAILVDGWLYLSGQLGINPESGEFVEGGTPAETEQIFRNLKAVLEAAGGSLQSIVATRVYLADMADFAAVNEVYKENFKDAPPARECVQVAALPKGGRVEISAVARIS
ncbi:MAG: reactive intermediate/imine deaminase [Planctomycetota bacterium]|nr:MAG: reactive intermediate/imine deaminase [Planctomycetota bacterium]